MWESDVNSAIDYWGGGMCVWSERDPDKESYTSQGLTQADLEQIKRVMSDDDLIMPHYESMLPMQIFFGIIIASMFIGAMMIMITCN